MTVLVLGSTGQLARHLRELWPEATFWSRTEADLADPALLPERIQNVAPSVLVNAAAYTSVDKAESEADLAWRVNVEAPAAMARAARALGIPMIHVSTDYVFDGQKATPYVESDAVAPLGVYGRTKLAGELAVASLCPKHWILRTSWVFSEYGSNFVKTMLRLARERDRISVVDDQIGRPTYAGDLAGLINDLLRQKQMVPWGLHHVGGGAAVSWHAFAVTILDRAQRRGLIPHRAEIAGIPTSAYPTPAKRPLHSILQPSPGFPDSIQTRLDWSAGLDRCLARLEATGG